MHLGVNDEAPAPLRHWGFVVLVPPGGSKRSVPFDPKGSLSVGLEHQNPASANWISALLEPVVLKLNSRPLDAERLEFQTGGFGPHTLVRPGKWEHSIELHFHPPERVVALIGGEAAGQGGESMTLRLPPS